jgi:hypothetical protein
MSGKVYYPQGDLAQDWKLPVHRSKRKKETGKKGRKEGKKKKGNSPFTFH